MKRTNDTRFNECPICGKTPYVKYYGYNYGEAWCHGSFFKPHKDIYAKVGWVNQYELEEDLAHEWNDRELEVTL